MSEENSDPNAGKLRLSRDANAPSEEQKEPATPEQPEEASSGGLNLKPKEAPEGGSGLGLSQPKAAADTPPPAQAQAAPPPQQGGGLEKTIERVDERSKKGSPIGSLIMIIVFLIVFAGGGYGIWMVLQGDDSESGEGGFSNLIEKAKSIIPSGGEGDQPLEEGPTVVPEVTAEAPPPPQPEPSREPVGSRQERVAEILRGLEIDAVRAGAKARFSSGGQNYDAGAMLDAETGLVFIGTKDGFLVFRDKKGVLYRKRF